MSKFAEFNKKMEALFKKIPVPFASYTQETGTLFGLAKYNIIHLSKKDTISPPSKISGVATISTNGSMALAGGTQLYFGKGKYIFMSGTYIKIFPEYYLGIGNTVYVKDMEKIDVEKWGLDFDILKVIGENLYFGINYSYTNYWKITKEDSSMLDARNILGKNGGTTSGFGVSLLFDSRDSKYNSSKGMYFFSSYTTYQKFLGSQFAFNSVNLDFRKYWSIWPKHILAYQIASDFNYGNVPFFDLSMMGGSDRMRGYYQGAIRDHLLIDNQIEFRIPIWKIFGFAAFFGAGRVFNNYNDLAFKDIYYAGGGGLRIMVDSENRANLRLDFAYGKYGVKAFIFGFAEAF